MAKKQVTPYVLGWRNSGVQEAPPFRPGINLGCLTDLPTGGYQLGRHGEMICIGGLTHLEGVGGVGNVNKSTYLHHRTLTAMDRMMPVCEARSHDSEYTQNYPRWNALAQRMPRLKNEDLSVSQHFMLTSQDDMSGNVFFEQVKERFQARKEARKSITYTTPFVDPRDKSKNLKGLAPSILEMDSLSALNMDVAQEIMDKEEVGSGKAQTVFMRAAGAKTQLFMQLPDLAAQNGGYVLYTSAMGQQINLDPYAPAPKKLQYLKNGLTFKNVPGNITQLSTNLWMITSAVPEVTRDKTVMYPKDSSDNVEGDTDLQKVTITNLRGKAGPSGLPFELLISQKQGVLVALSEFNYLKAHGRYGLGGNDRDYFLDIHPDVGLSRTTIRGLCDEDTLLQRAMEITSELLQIKLMYPEYKDILVAPKDLYKGLKEKGWDWEVLLKTRGYWVFDEVADQHAPFLSTLDLLRMNAGLYTPYWK